MRCALASHDRVLAINMTKRTNRSLSEHGCDITSGICPRFHRCAFKEAAHYRACMLSARLFTFTNNSENASLRSTVRIGWNTLNNTHEASRIVELRGSKICVNSTAWKRQSEAQICSLQQALQLLLSQLKSWRCTPQSHHGLASSSSAIESPPIVHFWRSTNPLTELFAAPMRAHYAG